MPRKQWNDGQEILDTDLSQASQALELELYDRVLYELMNRQQNVVFGDSFKVSYVNATTVQVNKGNGMYYDNTQTDPEPMTRQLHTAGNTNETIAAADATHNRIDLIYITPGRAGTSTASRNVKDANSGVVTPTSVTIENDWSPTIGVVTGTPAVSPAVPSTPAGSIALAQVLVTAATGVTGSSSITDVRPRFGKPSSWGGVTTVTSAYTADLDDDLILCNATGGAFAVTLPAVASCSGKKLTLKKTDSTTNAITVTGNASDNIDGSNTQLISYQYGSLTLRCDGSAWYLI